MLVDDPVSGVSTVTVLTSYMSSLVVPVVWTRKVECEDGVTVLSRPVHLRNGYCLHCELHGDSHGQAWVT